MAEILIVEDEFSINELIRRNLSLTGHRCTQALDGLSAAALLENGSFDLVVLDIMLPGLDGYQVYEKALGTPTIFLTAKSELSDKLKGLSMGADDYLTKPFGMLEMVSRVRAVLRRSRPRDGGRVLRAGCLELNTEEHMVSAGGERITLTLKEYELLRLFMEHPGRVFTRSQLLESVWESDYTGETRTVDVHIASLRGKLGICGDYIETVRGVGYRMEGRSS